MLHSRNKSKEYQERIVLKLTVLLGFLKDNGLIFIDPFNADGSLNLDFVLKKMMLSQSVLSFSRKSYLAGSPIWIRGGILAI